jgi:hypothetical protein
MRLRPRQWLTRRADWKQLAPDDAYLSCEYLPCSWEGEKEVWANVLVLDYDVRCELTRGGARGWADGDTVTKEDVDTLKNDWLTDNV